METDMQLSAALVDVDIIIVIIIIIINKAF